MLRIFTLIFISFIISINGTLINGTRSGSRSYNSRDNDPYLAFKKKKIKKKHKVKKNKILNIESYKKHAICLSWGGICLNTLVNAFKIREGRHYKSLLYFLRTSVGYKYQINEKWAIVGKVTVFGDRGHAGRLFSPPYEENLFIFNFGGGIERYYHKTSSGSIIGFSILVNLLYAGTYGDVCKYGYYRDFPLSTFCWTDWGLNVTIIPFLVKIQNWNIRIVTGCIDLKFLCGAIDDAINKYRNDNFECLISCLWRNIGIEIGREWSFE